LTSTFVALTRRNTQWGLHVKRVNFPGIGRFSAVTFGPSGARSQLPITDLFLRLVAGAAVGGARPTGQRAVKRIADLLLAEDILLDVDASGKNQLIDEIGRHMQRVHAMAAESVALSLSHREQIGSTGLGEGVALPHARVKNLDHVQVAYVRLKSPIPFDSPDGKPVSDVLVLLVPKQASEEHLTILAEAAQMLSDRRFRWRLHLCKSSMEVKRLFEAWPETQLAQ
jgi:PTS system nitrogen regulatory IIA component